MPVQTSIQTTTTCFHCGEPCNSTGIRAGDHVFCCEGCKMVYHILQQQGLCDYYKLNTTPGFNQRITVRNDKFAFLDIETVQSQLISFRNETLQHVTFYIPQIHCSSCLYLLEHLHKLNSGVISSTVHFPSKEVAIRFNSAQTSLRKVAELLTSIGYEPYISLSHLHVKKPVVEKGMIYRLGVAGFCFGNIMLMSFPEYLGIDASEAVLRNLFRWMNAVLAVPVFIYAAFPFYASAWKAIRHRFLNIDAPIALAIIITFTRSVWEVLAGTGSGYFDSMTGIVFFMLAGRILQEKTFRQLSFDRDYTAYFPVAVSVLKNEIAAPTLLPDIKTGDTLLLHNEELIPADGILTRGKACIDYSFVTGESAPVTKEMGELVYAGGKQKGGNIEILVVKEVAQSYLTSLWNKNAPKSGKMQHPTSFVQLLSRYFTYIVFGIAFLTALYWQFNDPSRLWVSVTAIFIIACPCALLLSNSFTNGNILRILSRNHFYLRNAQTIEAIARVNHIVFDKTGTLTSVQQQATAYTGKNLTPLQKQQIASLASCSQHPLSKKLVHELQAGEPLQVLQYCEYPGMGIQGMVNNDLIKIGSSSFVTGNRKMHKDTVSYISFNHETVGWFQFGNNYRRGMPALLKTLGRKYRISVLTGDNESDANLLWKMAGNKTTLCFNRTPEQKLAYVKKLQAFGETVMMIGDGLNDAGALMQADAGIAISEDNNNFTPSSDAILSARSFTQLSTFIRLCKANKNIVTASFIVSIVYNIIGLYYAVQGLLSPLVAAILMPSSTLCIFLITFGSSQLMARHLKL